MTLRDDFDWGWYHRLINKAAIQSLTELEQATLNAMKEDLEATDLPASTTPVVVSYGGPIHD